MRVFAVVSRPFRTSTPLVILHPVSFWLLVLQVLTSKGRCRDAQHDAANCCHDYDLDVDGDASGADVNDTRRCGIGESWCKGKAQIVNLVQGFRGFWSAAFVSHVWALWCCVDKREWMGRGRATSLRPKL